MGDSVIGTLSYELRFPSGATGTARPYVMRISGGAARGIPLTAPKGETVRPATDGMRQAVFSSLGARVGGARFLDLFAGSGALAIEAISRGAARATLVEQQPRVLRFLAEQIREFALADRVRVLKGDARQVLRGAPTAAGGPFSLVLIDPPYEDTAALLPVVAPALAAGWLLPEAIVVCEHDRTHALPAWPDGFVLEASRRYGQTGVDFLRWEGGASR